MSFALTTAQIKARTKFVTRRIGWLALKPGDRVQAVVKAQGIKKGEHVEKLCVIEIVSNRREPLDILIQDPEYGEAETTKEGFPEMTPEEFVAFFRRTHGGIKPEQNVTRIEFKYT